MLRKRDPNTASSIPSNLETNLLSNSPFAKNNHAVIETLLSELYYIIRTRKELKHNPSDIISELEKIIINYYNP